MKTIEINLDSIRENGIIADIRNGLKLDFIYNNYDDYIYLSLLDDLENRITGYFRLVPNIDFLALTNNDIKYQLRCIKVNENSADVDLITPENFNEDYKLFLIGEKE